jgi:hypothetical protein
MEGTRRSACSPMLFPKAHITTLPGKHRKWVFNELWREILDRHFNTPGSPCEPNGNEK